MSTFLTTYHLGIKACITNRNHEILLLKRPYTKVQKNFFWDFPGGLNERSESIETTLLREVREETGLSGIKIIKLLYSFIVDPELIIDSTQRILFIYHCKLTQEEQITLSREHIGYEWVRSEEATGRLTLKYPHEFLRILSNKF